MGKIKLLNTIAFLALTIPNYILVFFGAFARLVEESEAFGTTIREVARLNIFGGLSIFVYENEILTSSTIETAQELGLNYPAFTVTMVLISLFLGLSISAAYIETREFDPKTVDSLKLKPQVYKMLYRAFAGAASLISLLGFIGLLIFIQYINEIQTNYIEVKISYAFYYLAISYFTACLISGFRLIVPPKTLWRHLNREIRKQQVEEEALKVEKQPEIESKLDVEEETIENGVTTDKIEKIKTLIAGKKETAITWMETITQYPREEIEKILQEELDFVI